MANEEHLAILQQGVEGWNAWREANPDIKPDLQGASLEGANLQGVHLWMANLWMAILQGANLRGAKLRGANLRGTRLQEAKLQEAILRGADLSGADLSGADLSGADLFRADLQEAILRGAILRGANVMGARVDFTVFGNLNLSAVRGLDTLHHSGPSTVGIDTLYRSQGQIPESFLRGCGVPDSMIEYARSLVAAQRPIDYYSVFISYSSQDEAIAQRLHADLQAKGVRCWFAPHDLPIGTPIVDGIDEAIRIYDKLLIILSEAAVKSGWVEYEATLALTRENTERRKMLFPIRLDDTVLHLADTWAAKLRTRNIGDFRAWKDHDRYQAAFTRLLRDLVADDRAMEPKPKL